MSGRGLTIRCDRCGEIIPGGDRCDRCRTSKAGQVPARRLFPARLIQGMSYPILALSLLRARSVRRFLILPLAITLLLFLVLVVGAVLAYNPLFERFITSGEGFWATVLWWLGLVVLLLALGVIFMFSFTSLGTIVAGPFLEPISRRAETEILGAPGTEQGRGIVGEAIYSATQTGGMILVALGAAAIIVPIGLCVPVVGPIIAFVLASWVAAIEYMDATFARKRYPLGEKIDFVLRNRAITLGFGMAILALLLVPLINLFVLPLGSVAATMMYLDIAGKSAGGTGAGGSPTSHVERSTEPG